MNRENDLIQVTHIKVSDITLAAVINFKTRMLNFEQLCVN